MKRICCLLGLLVFLSGCAPANRELQAAMTFRDRLLSAKECRFLTAVTADYGEAAHCFRMDCQADETGMIRFEIREPDTIAGISGTINAEGGSVSFADTAVYFNLLTDDQLTPAAAPWILLKSLRSGYVSAACTEADGIHITLDDSYEAGGLTVDVWLEQDVPVRGDILYDGRRILSLEVENFVMM